METDQRNAKAVKAIESAKGASGKSETGILFGGLTLLSYLASNKQGKGEADSDQRNNDGSSTETAKEEERKAKIAEDKFKVALKEEMGEGLINIDRQEDKVIITVGSGGAFKSGSADLAQNKKNYG